MELTDVHVERAAGKLSFAIGGVALTVIWTGSRIREWPDPLLYDAFSTDTPRPPDVTLRVHCGALPEASGDLAFDGTDNHWRLYATDRGFTIEVLDVRSHQPHQVAHFDRDFAAGDVHITPEPGTVDGWSLRRLMRPIGELVVIRHLQGHGLLLHGSAVSDRGEGLVFVGPSGAGKTTMANLWSHAGDATVLNDERVVVRKHGEAFRVHGTPWCGSRLEVSAADVPLRGLFLIAHAAHNTFDGGASATFIGELFSQAFVPFWNASALASSLAVCEEVVTSVESRRLGFVNDPDVVAFLRESLG